MRPITTWCAAAILAIALASCSNEDNDPTAAPSAAEISRTVIVLGGSDTQAGTVPDRLHDAWPYRMFREALPLSTVFVNAAVDGATAEDARRTQLPIVRELEPDVVVVWLGDEDVRRKTPARDFARALSRVVAGAQTAGAERVLVGNLPDAYGKGVRPYNNAILHTVRETGAELVELDREHIALADEPGFAPHIDVASHRVVADAFGRRIAAG
jgi:hypothetical protein